jgi:hypothetical protein
MPDRKTPDEHTDHSADGPEDTALGEVLREIEDAETRRPASGDEEDREGEAADAITPNAGAQKQSEQHADGESRKP